MFIREMHPSLLRSRAYFFAAFDKTLELLYMSMAKVALHETGQTYSLLSFRPLCFIQWIVVFVDM